MSRTLHPALKVGAATALALALTATAVLPAAAINVAADATAVPVTGTDPANQSGQAASEVKGAEEQSISLGGIDPEAVPEVAETEPAKAPENPELPEYPEVSESPEMPETAEISDATAPAGPSEASQQTESGDVPEPSGPAASTEHSEDSISPLARMSSTVSDAGDSGPGTSETATDRESRPSGVVIRQLQRKAAATAAATDAPAVAEAGALKGTVLDEAPSTTQEIDPEQISTLTQPLQTMDFIVAGVTWDIEDAGHVTDVSLRVRESGAWTDWNSMEIHGGDEAPHADRVGTEPLISSGGDAIQVRVTTVDGHDASGLELELIDPGMAETDGKLEPASPASPASPDVSQAEAQAEQASYRAASVANTDAARFTTAVQRQQGPITGTATATTVANNKNVLKPSIITRAQWGADESVVQDWGTPSTDLKAMYVHHTAGSNHYTEAGAYAQIRGIFNYHAVSLGWGDIGYQFLVDKFGNIYQGRRGSIDQAVQGAQAGGFNTDTIGVSAMGNYDVAAAPAAMVRAIESVLAWQAHRYGVDPTSTVTLTQRGKGTARWSDGRRVTVPTILGHKVTNFTACPGRYLDAQLPTIRRNVERVVADAPTAVQPPSAPGVSTNQYSVSTNGADATARWQAVSGVDEYQIMYRAVQHGAGSVGNQSWLAGKTMTTTSTDLSNLPGETAQYAVRAIRQGVPSPQTYLGQHTAPLDWDNANVFTARFTATSSSGGVKGRAVRATANSAVVRVENAAHARRLGVALYVPSNGVADFAVYQDSDRYVGTIRVRDSGSAYCAINLPGGSNVRLVSQNDTEVMVSRMELAQSGQSDRRASSAICETPFFDNAPGSRFYDAVDWMYNAGISSGYSSDNTFRKDQEISRGESVAFVHRYVNPQYTPEATTPFKDVSRGDTFYEPISWAKDAKVAQGFSGGSFRVGQDVTRGEFASFLYRAAKPEFSVPKSKAFPDVATGSAHHAAIAWMEKEDLAGGYSDGSFRPTRTITRGEASVILHRYHVNQ